MSKLLTKEQEREVMIDLFNFLKDYGDAPPMYSEDANRYFDKVGQRMTTLFNKWNRDDLNHRLIEEGCYMIFKYLEYKSYMRTAEEIANGKKGST